MLPKMPRGFPLPGLLGFLADQPGIGSEIHQSFYRVTWNGAAPAERVTLVLKALWWPLFVLGGACFFTARNGLIVAKRTGKPVWKQFAEQMYLGFGRAIEPRVYYAFELYYRRNRRRVSGYLQRYETKDALYRYLKSAWRIPATPANNKLEFEEYLLKHQLPTVRTVAAFTKGQRIDATDPLVLPEEDLFMKPRNGRGGEKCMRYRFVRTGWQAVNRQKVMSASELIAHVRSASRKRPYMLQRCYQVHRDLADLAVNTLATVRVVSVTDTKNDVQALYAAFRMPRGQNDVVDNFHAGGIAASVDIATGKLGAATNLGNSQAFGWVNRHPASGAPIRGRILPYWQEVVALARHAHAQAFRDRIILGWDIAITDDGPIIVEGNAAPDLDIIQRVCRVPLGNDRFGELLLDHIRAAELQGRPAALTAEIASKEQTALIQ